MTSNASTAGSMDESNFLKQSRSLHLARLGLSLLITAGAVAVVACEAVPLQNYQTTSQWATAGLALWPLNLDIRPTIAGLSCGCVIAVLNLVYVVVALLPSPHSRIKLLNSYGSASALSGFITALIGIIFMIYRPSASYPSGFSQGETLHSWTCKWEASIGFSRNCHETRAGFGMLCVLLGLEILMGFASAAGTWSQWNVSRRREEQAHLEKLDIATKQVYQP